MRWIVVLLFAFSAVFHPPIMQVAHAQVIANPAVSFPVAASRDKFSPDVASLVDAIEMINRAVNAAMTYRTDIDQYGEMDKWVSFPESWEGDCEDYAVTKLETLRQSGWPILSLARVTMLYVKGGGGHAVLEVLLPSGEIAVLDNNHDALMTRAELIDNYGYVFYDWIPR
jgi:predicted transglutaminase-like cysteine proteinase